MPVDVLQPLVAAAQDRRTASTLPAGEPEQARLDEALAAARAALDPAPGAAGTVPEHA